MKTLTLWCPASKIEFLISSLYKFFPLLIWGWVLLVFSPAPFHSFVSFDDGLNIYSNPYLNPPTVSTLGEFWSAPYGALYIPVTYSLWWVAAQVSYFFYGVLHPFIFHGLSVFFHAVNSVLVFFVLSKFRLRPFECFVGAMAFGIHPVQVEATAWASGFKDICGSFFFLMALVCSLSEKPRYSICFLFYVLAVLSKPMAVVFPLFLWICLKFAHQPIPRGFLLSTLVTGLLISVFTKYLQADSASMAYVLPLWQRPLIALDALLFYLAKLLFPFHLSLHYGRTPPLVISDLHTLLVNISSAVLIVYFICKLRVRLLYFAMALFVVGLLPTLGFIPFYYQNISTVADRFTYLSLIGVGLLFSQVPRFAGVIIIIGWTVLSVLQLGVWKNDRTLLERMVSAHPEDPNLYFSLGQLYFRIPSENEKAYWMLQRAIQLNPRHFRAHHQMGQWYDKKNRISEAIESYQTSLHLQPSYLPVYNDLGVAYSRQANYVLALDYLLRASVLQPDEANVDANLGLTWQLLGREDRAQQSFQRALLKEPDHPIAKRLYGVPKS